jgi:hypothetical protein
MRLGKQECANHECSMPYSEQCRYIASTTPWDAFGSRLFRPGNEGSGLIPIPRHREFLSPIQSRMSALASFYTRV